MNMNWLQSILYGLVSGVCEVLPISSQAHQALLASLFGSGETPGSTRLVIHLAVIVGLLAAMREYITGLNKEMSIYAIPAKRRRRQPEMQAVLDVRLTNTAFIPLAIGFFFYPLASKWNWQLNMTSLFLVVNGIVLLLPQYFATGNKDSRNMSMLEAVLLGLAAAVSVLPGLSTMACVLCAASLCGADKKQAVNWSFLLLSITLVFFVGFDIRQILLEGMQIGSFGGFIQLVLCGAAASLGAYFSVIFMRFMAAGIGFSNFSYYCWGAALFMFILYLI